MFVVYILRVHQIFDKPQKCRIHQMRLVSNDEIEKILHQILFVNVESYADFMNVIAKNVNRFSLFKFNQNVFPHTIINHMKSFQATHGLIGLHEIDHAANV